MLVSFKGFKFYMHRKLSRFSACILVSADNMIFLHWWKTSLLSLLLGKDRLL